MATEPADQPPSSTPADSIASSSFSFETPSPTASRGTRARARVAEGAMPSSDDLDSKGGRSLRKRARVDYTFDHADEYISDGGKTTPPSMRDSKRRRTETFLPEVNGAEECVNSHMKRRSSEQLPPPSSALRKRTQTRKSMTEPQTLMPNHHTEEAEVHDTIEVGGHQSEQSDESTLRRTSSNTSSGFSNDNLKLPRMAATFDSLSSPRKSHLGMSRVAMDDTKHQSNGGQLSNGHTYSSHVEERFTDEPLPASYEHLTPYIDNAYVEWPSARLDAEPGSDLQPLQQDIAEEAADYQVDGAPTAQENTPVADPLVPDSTPVDGPIAETPAISPLPTDTRANSPTENMEIPYAQPPPKRPITYKKTRDASEFTSLFENFKSLPPAELWARLQIVNRALDTWQQEYNGLRKITDDEDNAARYRQEEAAFEHRHKMLTSKDPDANPIRKDFVVRGIRAERPHPEIAHARYQDKLMATNYYFEYDDKESKIGFQDPAEQKTGSGKGRLRDRPKQTAKAAEADDGNVVQGKRIRKPPVVFDGSEAVSRGSTPAPTQRRRRRVGQAAEENDEVSLAVPTSTDTPAEQLPPKKKGKGGRPRKHPLPAPILEVTPAPTEEAPEPPKQIEEEKPAPKRRRKRTVAEVSGEEEAPTTNGADQQSPPKNGLRSINSRLFEVPSGSFYTSSMPSANNVDESRPQTASSTATHSTVTSKNNYQLREKRQKKFSLNPDDEVYDEEPKPKRVKRTKKTQVEDFAAPALPMPIPAPVQVQQPTPESNPAPKPPTKIKLKNYTAPVAVPPPASAPAPNPFSVPSSSSSTPPHSNHDAATDGVDPVDAKDYNLMTKSEKMSHSMKGKRLLFPKSSQRPYRMNKG